MKNNYDENNYDIINVNFEECLGNLFHDDLQCSVFEF